MCRKIIISGPADVGVIEYFGNHVIGASQASDFLPASAWRIHSERGRSPRYHFAPRRQMTDLAGEAAQERSSRIRPFGGPHVGAAGVPWPDALSEKKRARCWRCWRCGRARPAGRSLATIPGVEEVSRHDPLAIARDSAFILSCGGCAVDRQARESRVVPRQRTVPAWSGHGVVRSRRWRSCPSHRQWPSLHASYGVPMERANRRVSGRTDA